MDFSVLIVAGATIGGALAGGVIAFGAAVWRERRKERKIKEGFIRLLICDIDSFWPRYHESIGKEIENHDENEIFLYTMHVNQNYFSIFDNNSDKILYLDDKTARQVVKFYNLAKIHIFNLDIYNETVKKYVAADSPERKQIKEELKKYFSQIRTQYADLKNITSETKSALEAQLEK